MIEFIRHINSSLNDSIVKIEVGNYKDAKNTDIVISPNQVRLMIFWDDVVFPFKLEECEITMEVASEIVDSVMNYEVLPD